MEHGAKGQGLELGGGVWGCAWGTSLPYSTKMRSRTFLPDMVTNSSEMQAKSPAT